MLYVMIRVHPSCEGVAIYCFFFNDTATTEIYTLSLHDALPISRKARTEKEAHGEFESECPGYCGAQDTFHVGTMKGVGRIYRQTFVDTYGKVAFAKLYDRKTPITAADLLNDRVMPLFEEPIRRASCRVRVSISV